MVLGVPFGFKFVEPLFSQLGGGRGVNQLEVSRHFPLPFPRYEVQTVAHHVHDAQLNDGFWVNRFNRLREAFEAVHAGDEDEGRS